VEIQPSEPIVPFRETAIRAPGMFVPPIGTFSETDFSLRISVDMPPPKTPGYPRGTVHGASFQNLVTFTLRAVPLPDVIADFLRSNLTVIKRLVVDSTRSENVTPEEVEDEAEKAATSCDILRVPTVHPGQFWDVLQAKCEQAGPEWAGIVDNIWALGPQGAGECLLIDSRKVPTRQSSDFSSSPPRIHC
jgi:ribosome assembly protein 1